MGLVHSSYFFIKKVQSFFFGYFTDKVGNIFCIKNALVHFVYRDTVFSPSKLCSFSGFDLTDFAKCETPPVPVFFGVMIQHCQLYFISFFFHSKFAYYKNYRQYSFHLFSTLLHQRPNLTTVNFQKQL